MVLCDHNSRQVRFDCSFAPANGADKPTCVWYECVLAHKRGRCKPLGLHSASVLAFYTLIPSRCRPMNRPCQTPLSRRENGIWYINGMAPLPKRCSSYYTSAASSSFINAPSCRLKKSVKINLAIFVCIASEASTVNLKIHSCRADKFRALFFVRLLKWIILTIPPINENWMPAGSSNLFCSKTWNSDYNSSNKVGKR